MNLTEVLFERAGRHPGRPALVEGGGERRRVVTYGELAERVEAGRRRLADLGVEPGDAVLFLHPVSVDLYEALLAVFRAGAVAVFIDPSASRALVSRALERVRPRAFFASPKAHLWRLLHPAVRRIPVAFVTVDWIGGVPWRSRPGIEGGAAGAAKVKPEAAALITFTSGSTGEPKAVARSHGFLLTQDAVLRRAIHLEEGEVDLVTLPVFALANLAAGLTSVLADTNLARPGDVNARRVERQLLGERVTRCAASPAFFDSLLRRGADLTGLEKIYAGGAPVFPPLLQRLAEAAPRARVVAVYGSTEAEPIAHLEHGEMGEREIAAMRAGRGLLAGRPVREIDLAVLPNRWGTCLTNMEETDFKRDCLEAGVPGEIVVSGAHVLTGYLDGRGDEETKFRVGEQIWHRTGDAGWMDEEGRLWLLGRAGAVIRRLGGREVHPFAVETAVSFVPGLRRTALVERNGTVVLAAEWDGPGRAGERELEADAARLGVERIATLRRIPVDRRHQAKVDYPALAKRL